MIRVALWLALATGLVLGGWLMHRQAYRTGWEAGSAAIRAEWHLDSLRQQTALTEALERQQAVAQEIERGLSEKLAAADTRGRDLAGRLRSALGSTGTCPVPATSEPAGSTDGAAGKPGNPTDIGEALASHLVACERDAERLGQLQVYWFGLVLH